MLFSAKNSWMRKTFCSEGVLSCISSRGIGVDGSCQLCCTGLPSDPHASRLCCRIGLPSDPHASRLCCRIGLPSDQHASRLCCRIGLGFMVCHTRERSNILMLKFESCLIVMTQASLSFCTSQLCMRFSVSVMCMESVVSSLFPVRANLLHL